MIRSPEHSICAFDLLVLTACNTSCNARRCTTLFVESAKKNQFNCSSQSTAAREQEKNHLIVRRRVQQRASKQIQQTGPKSGQTEQSKYNRRDLRAGRLSRVLSRVRARAGRVLSRARARASALPNVLAPYSRSRRAQTRAARWHVRCGPCMCNTLLEAQLDRCS
jgi:hypothetical protein